MRNLKRALSLALAAVMVLGMMVIGAGAASTYDSFADKDEIVNKEAVNTMVSLGVIAGKEDGSYFDPTGIVTRAEMAKIVAVSLNGGKDPVMGADAKTTFSDVPASHWAVAYIAYCVQQNIIAGRGDGTFGPEEPVTGSAAAKMFLCALGYRADLEGLTGNNWEINTNVLANQDADLYDGLAGLNASAGLSRDNTAQMLYNTVQAQEVYYDNLQGSHTDVIQSFNKGTMLANRFGVAKVEGVVMANNIVAIDDGATTVAGKVRLNDISQNGVAYVDNDGNTLNATYPVELGNEYLGRRVVLYVKGLKDLSPNASSMTVVGEPILSDMNTVAETANRLKDVAAVKSFLSGEGLSLPDSVRNSAVNGTVYYTKNATVYGNVPTRTFAANSTSNVNGDELVFIDHDGDGQVDFIFKTRPQLAKVTVYNETDRKVTIAGEGAIDFAEIANEEDVAKDDIILYYKANETYYLQKAETVSGPVDSYNDSSVKVTVSGTSYGKSTVDATLTSTDLTKFDAGMEFVGNSYTFYLDNHGNAVAWVLDEEGVGNYAMILGTDVKLNAGFESATVKLLLSDGTTGTYGVNLLASANKFAGLKDLGTSGTKEHTMALLLSNDADDDGTFGEAGDDAVTAGGVTYAGGSIMNMIVTYAVGENGKVTLGDPDVLKNYDALGNGTDTATAAPQPAIRSTARYHFDGDTAKYVVVNDSTIFFIRNITNSISAADTYNVVNGLSNMPTTEFKKSDNAVLSGASDADAVKAVYTTTSANNRVARAVVIDGKFDGVSNFVYITDSYTGTLTVNGEEVYTYPCVFEDGTVGTINVNRSSVVDGEVYRYTMGTDNVADLTQPPHAMGGSGVLNGYVSTYARGSNLTIRTGANASANTDSWTVAAGAKLWNVENTPYAETLSSDMDVCLVFDNDGFIRTAFVKNTNVTTANVTIASGLGGLAFAGPVTRVHSGYTAVVTGAVSNDVLTYVVTYDDGSTETKTVTVNSSNQGRISIPKNARSVQVIGLNDTIGGGGSTTGVDANSPAADVNAALESGNVSITGLFAPTAQIKVPAGKTLTITGEFKPSVMPSVDATGSLIVTGDATLPAGNLYGTTNVTGTLTLGASTYVNGTVTANAIGGNSNILVNTGATLTVATGNLGTGTLTTSGTVNVASTGSGAVTMKAGILNVGTTSGGTFTGGTVGGALTVEGGTVKTGAVTGAVVVSGGTVETGALTAGAAVSGTGKLTVGTTAAPAAVGGNTTVAGSGELICGDITGTLTMTGGIASVGAVSSTVGLSGTSVANLSGDTGAVTLTAGTISVKEDLTMASFAYTAGAISIDAAKTLTVTAAGTAAAYEVIAGNAGSSLVLGADSSTATTNTAVGAAKFHTTGGNGSTAGTVTSTAIDTGTIKAGTYLWLPIYTDASGTTTYSGWALSAT